MNIKMKKTEIKAEVPEVKEKVIESPKIGKLELDFNNDGLNKMAAKINEIIECLK